MTAFEIFTSPFIQLFILGLVAGIFKSDLNIPEDFTKAITLYLMLAIGLKGGVTLANNEVQPIFLIKIATTGVLVGFLLPFLGYIFLKKFTSLDQINSANIASHYGSISAVTFSYTLSFLDRAHIPYSAYMITLMALMESPGIIAGLMLARKNSKKSIFSKCLLSEVLLNSSIVLLLGGMIIGYTSPQNQILLIKPYLIDPFYGILCLFMLEMGLLVAKHSHSLKKISPKVFAFGIYMPIISAMIGILLSAILGFQVGNALLFSTLCAGASYIAVPATMKHALPKANHSLSITLSLCITFTFNIILGVPLYYYIIQFIL